MSIDCARVIRGIHSIASASRPAAAYLPIASRRRAGSSEPTSSAPLSVPFRADGAGPVTVRIIPASLSTSAREPTLAPAVSNSASAIDAPSPVPRSTATSAPSAMNFLTVSGTAAQRVSPAASFRTAIFIRLFQDQKNDEADDEAGDGAIFEQAREAHVVPNVHRNVLGWRTHEDRFFFGHFQPFFMSKRERVHNKASPASESPIQDLKMAFTAATLSAGNARRTDTFAVAARCKPRGAPADLRDRRARGLERGRSGRRGNGARASPGPAWPRSPRRTSRHLGLRQRPGIDRCTARAAPKASGDRAFGGRERHHRS